MATKTTKRAAAGKSTTKARVTTVKAVASRPARSRATTLTSSVKIGALLAELVGTFLLVATIVSGQNQPILVLFALVGIVLAVGAYSGAHLNPAVTVAAWVTRKMTTMRAFGYVVAQVVGGTLALVVLNGFVNAAPEPSSQAVAFGQQAVSLFKAASIPQGHEWTVLFAELLGAAIFGFAFATARRQADRVARAATIGIGFYVGLLIAGSAAAAVSASAILNPAAAIGLQALNFDNIWPIAIYVFATLVGAVIGFLISDLLVRESGDVDA